MIVCSGRDRHGRRPRGRPAVQPGARVRRPRQPHHRGRLGGRRGRHGAPRRPESRRRDRCSTCSARWPTRSSGRSSMLKVLSGVVRPSDRLHNATTGVDERIHGLFRLAGGRAPAGRRPPRRRRRRRREAHGVAVGVAAVDPRERHRPSGRQAAPRAGVRGEPRAGHAVRRREADVRRSPGWSQRTRRS